MINILLQARHDWELLPLFRWVLPGLSPLWRVGVWRGPLSIPPQTDRQRIWPACGSRHSSPAWQSLSTVQDHPWRQGESGLELFFILTSHGLAITNRVRYCVCLLSSVYFTSCLLSINHKNSYEGTIFYWLEAACFALLVCVVFRFSISILNQLDVVLNININTTPAVFFLSVSQYLAVCPGRTQ